jgi:hypothetical protein
VERIPIADFYSDYCKAMDWVEKTIQKVPVDNRFYQYRETLKKQLDEHIDGELKHSGGSEMKLHTEANLEAFVLVDVYKKFSNRADKEFKDKLREMLFGPPYSSDEQSGEQNPVISTLGRDIGSELILASKLKNPERISFVKSDIVCDLVEYKFGFECKRIHSDEKIIRNFNRASAKLQENENIDYGFVALRLDKFFFQDKIGGVLLPRPMLVERGDGVFGSEDKDAVFRELKIQTRTFFEVYHKRFAALIWENKWNKVAGYCVWFYLPCFIGNPIVINPIGFVEFVLINFTNGLTDLDPNKKLVFSKMGNEFDFGNPPELIQ